MVSAAFLALIMSDGLETCTSPGLCGLAVAGSRADRVHLARFGHDEDARRCGGGLEETLRDREADERGGVEVGVERRGIEDADHREPGAIHVNERVVGQVGDTEGGRRTATQHDGGQVDVSRAEETTVAHLAPSVVARSGRWLAR